MSNQEQTTIEVKPVEVSQNNTQNEILSYLKKFDERLTQVEEKKFTKNEIKDIAQQNIIEREVEYEEAKLKTDRLYEIKRQGEMNLQVRNEIMDDILDSFMSGECPPMLFKQAAKGNTDFANILGAALFWHLAPAHGLNESYIRNNSLLKLEQDFTKGNNFHKIIRNFYK